MNGVKFSIAHSLVFAPFMMKAASLDKTLNPKNLPYRQLYRSHCTKAFFFYTIILGSTFGLRQCVIDNRDQIVF